MREAAANWRLLSKVIWMELWRRQMDKSLTLHNERKRHTVKAAVQTSAALSRFSACFFLFNSRWLTTSRTTAWTSWSGVGPNYQTYKFYVRKVTGVSHAMIYLNTFKRVDKIN